MSDVRWEGFTHEEIYARVQTGPGRAASADAETAWGTVASTIRDVDAQLTRAARDIGIGWEGAAADNVRGGMTVMSNWALDAAGDAELTRNGISAQADAAAHVRAAMPPPQTAHWTEAVTLVATDSGLVLGMPDAGALEDRMAGDRAAAVELMNRYTSDSSTNQRMMNYWTPPPSVVVETVTAGAAGAAGAAVAGVLAPAALVPGTGSAGGRSGGSGTGRTRLDPGTGAGLGPAGGAPARRGGSPGAAAPAPVDGPVPAGRGSGPVGVPPFVPGVPGPGTGGGAGGTRPRTELPGGVRPVVPGPPPRTGALPDGSGPPRGTPGADRGGVAPVPHTAPGPPGATPPGAGLPGGAHAGGRLPGDLPAAGHLPGDRPSRAIPAAPGGVLGAPGEAAPCAPTDGLAPGRSLLEPGAAAERLAGAGRGTTVHGAGFLPLGGMPISSTDQEHRRPDYLVDDTDAFADDRPFTPAVLGGGDHGV